MNKIKKIILRIAIVIGIVTILFTLVGGFVAYKISKRTQRLNATRTLEAHELTEKDKEFLNKKYPDDEDNIEAGMLYPYQYSELERVRRFNAYLEEKYPGYQFVYLYIINNADLFGGFGERNKSSYREISYYFLEKTSERKVKLSQRIYEDGTIELKDNFYAYFIEEDYAAYYKEQLEQRIDGVVEVNAYMSKELGKECDSRITVEDITDGKFDVYSRVNIILCADGMTEEECRAKARTVEESLKKINSKKIHEYYKFYFYDGTEEEILDRKNGDLTLVYKYYFGTSVWESEDEE